MRLRQLTAFSTRMSIRDCHTPAAKAKAARTCDDHMGMPTVIRSRKRERLGRGRWLAQVAVILAARFIADGTQLTLQTVARE